MLKFPGLEAVDYLLIGHITQDLTPLGPRIGGTASFAARTAYAHGLRVGVVTSWGEESGGEMMEGIAIANHPTERSTTFENIYTPQGRVQKIHHLAPSLDYYHIPELWRNTPVIHLGPIAQEVSTQLMRYFPDSRIYLTPQGWMRGWDEEGRVFWEEWPELRHVLRQSAAVVISEEDIPEDPALLEAMAEAAPILAVTQGHLGVNLYLEGQTLHADAPQVDEVDPTGAGDIFAAAFFIRLSVGDEPLEAAKHANLVAADSVTRRGLASAPTKENLYDILTEVK